MHWLYPWTYQKTQVAIYNKVWDNITQASPFLFKKKKKQMTKQNKNDGVDHYCIVVNTLLQPLLYGLTLFFYYSQSITSASCEI